MTRSRSRSASPAACPTSGTSATTASRRPTANPTHTYAEPGLYTARLTVTYADGEEASRAVEVNASDDAVAPTTAATLDPAAPGAGGTYEEPVEVTLSAADGAEGTGVDFTEYRVNTDGDTGEWTTSENAEGDDPFVTTFEVDDEGDHVVEFRSRDAAGNLEATKSVAFEIAGDDPPGGGASCLPQSDEFAGDALDPKWDLLRAAAGGPVVADGKLTLPLLQGDFIANDPLASNTLLQTLPDGAVDRHHESRHERASTPTASRPAS